MNSTIATGGASVPASHPEPGGASVPASRPELGGASVLASRPELGGASVLASRPPPPPARYFGWSACHSEKDGHLAAIVPAQVTPDTLKAIYKKLCPDARHHPLLAKKWKVWGVLATDGWAWQNRELEKAP